MPYTISAEESRRFNVSRALEILPDAPDAEKVWGVRTLAGQARMTLPAEFTSNPSDALSRLQEAYRTNSIEPLQTDDFKETEKLLREGNWDELAKRGAASDTYSVKAGDKAMVSNDEDVALLDEQDQARFRDLQKRVKDLSTFDTWQNTGLDIRSREYADLYARNERDLREAEDQFNSLLNEARKRGAAMRHVQRVRQKNAFTLLNSISADLDDRTREIVDRAVANGYKLADGDEDAFAMPEERGGLPESQKELAASFLLYCKPVEGKGAWDAFLKRMGDNAAQVVGNTASGVGDLFSGVFHGFDKDSYRDRVNRRAWINRINARNFADLGTLGNSFAEAGGIIGYWTPQLIGGAVGRGTRLAAARLPGLAGRIAGGAVGTANLFQKWGPEAMYFADYRQQFLERVALDGGDVTNPAFQVAATVGAAASAYVEHIQWGRAMGKVGLEEVQAQAYAKLSHRILAKLGIKVGTEFGSMTAGRAARLVLMERGLSAVTEGFEEAIQQAIEETVVQFGDGRGIRLADIADQSGEAFVSTLGPMMWTMMFGLPFRAKSAATMHNLDGDAIDRLMSAGSRLKRLAAEGKLDQGGDDLASLNELLFVTSRAPNADAGVRSLRERGFSQRQAADIWNTFEAIKREAIQHGQMEALGRNVLPTREELERTGWTVNPDMTASRMVETADGRKRRQTIKVRTEASQAVNIADDEQAASSLNTIRQDVEGRMAPSVNEDGTPGAIRLADKIASTYGFDLSLDNEAILANPAMREGLARYAADNDLRIAGNTRLVETRKAKGAEIDEDVFDVPLTEKATRQTIFHEVAHAVATTLRNMGLSEKEIDAIQNWRSGLDGKAPSEADLALPQVAGEAWDEERVGDELGDLITEPDGRGRVAKAMNFIGDMTRRILGIQKQQNDLQDAVSVLRAAVERGFFGNIDDLNDAQRRVLLAARQKRAEEREKRKAEPPAPGPAEGAVIAPAPPPEETNPSEIPTGSESQTDVEEETPPAEEPKSALERGQDAFVAGKPLQADEMAALAASGDVSEDEVYATGYRWHYAANAWVIAPEAVGQAFVPSDRYMGLDGQMHDAADFAGDASFDFGENALTTDEHLQALEEDELPEDFDAGRFSIASSLQTGIESTTTYTDSKGKKRTLYVLAGDKKHGFLKVAFKHCVDFGTAKTGGFTLDEIQRYENSILQNGVKRFDKNTGRRTITWKSPEGVTFTVGTYLEGRGRNVNEIVNTVYTDRGQKETRALVEKMAPPAGHVRSFDPTSTTGSAAPASTNGAFTSPRTPTGSDSTSTAPGSQAKSPGRLQVADRPSPEFAMDGTIADALPAHLREDARAIIRERAGTPSWMTDTDGTPTDLSERDWLEREAKKRKNAPRFAVKPKKAGEKDGNLVAVHFVGMDQYFSMIDAGGKLIAPSIAVSDADSPRYWGGGVHWAEPDAGIVMVMKPEALDNADGNVDIFSSDAGTPMVQMLDDENVTDPDEAVRQLREFRGAEFDNILQGQRTFKADESDASMLSLVLMMRRIPEIGVRQRETIRMSYDVKTEFGAVHDKNIRRIVALGKKHGTSALGALLKAGTENLDKKAIQEYLATKSVGRKPSAFAKAANDILAVINTIDQEPRGYLEAKVYRAVPLTDVALAIVNEEDAGELVDDLETRGVQKVVVARSKDEVDAAIKQYAPRFQVAPVYTGTAADYDKPSLHYIGTGEGAQVYGWGLYGSSVRGVAETYAGNTGNIYEQTFFTNREPGDESHLMLWYSHDGVRGLVKKIRQNLTPEQQEEFRKAYNRAYRSGPGGSAVEVWNKDIYDILYRMFGSSKATSEFLRDKCDIDGVKYPVDSLGGPIKNGDVAGWNYVSFRDDNIRVDHKWVNGEQRFQVASTAGAERLGIRNLADAEAMERSGASRLDIWRETGWQRGTDGEWRRRDDPPAPQKRFAVAPHGVQKQAGVEYPDAGEEIARFQVGAKRRAAYEDVLAHKRPDLDADAVLKELDKLDDPKKEKLALHWIVRGTIRLPEDAYKVEDALEVAGKAKVDPFQYGSPMELIEANKRFKPTPRGPIDPDTVPQLTDKTDMGHGVTVYLVQDDADGQKVMREILNAAYGKEFSPWCLLHGDGKGGLSSQAEHWWGHYSSLPKKVAFMDGKPIAFMATHNTNSKEPPTEKRAELIEKYHQETGLDHVIPNATPENFDWTQDFKDWLKKHWPPEEWWDLKDVSHEGIPATVQVDGDPLGRVHQALIMPDGALKDDSHGWERHSDGVDEEWYGYTYHRKEQTSKGDIDARWYTNGSKGMEVNVRRAGQELPDLVEWARIDNSGNFSYRDTEADVFIHGSVDAGTVISADGRMNEPIFKAVRSAGDWKIDTIGDVDASAFRKAFDAWLARFTELTTRPADSIGPEEREQGGRAAVAGRVRAFDDEPQYSPRASLAAVATMELLAGREPDRDALEQMRTRLGLEADVDEVIGEAKAVLDSAVGEIARRGAGRNPGAVAVAIAESVQAGHPEDLVQEAFRAGANAQKWAQGTRGAALNAIVRNTRGDNYADLVMETGVDATGVLQSFPDMVRRRRAERQEPAPAPAGERPDEATEAKPAPVGEPPSLADIGPIDPNSPEGRRIAALREQQEANIEKAIRETEKEMEQRRLDAWLEDAAKRQKAEADAKAADPDSDDDGGDADIDEGDESGVSDEIKIPVEVLERNLVDASDPETFTLWLRKVVRNRILKANGMSADFQTLKEAQEAEKQLWANPTNVAAFAKSMSAILRDMARRMLDHGSGAYTEVIRKAATLPHYDNVDAIEDEVAFEVGVMSSASISQTSAQLVSETRRKLKRDFIGATKPNEHPELQDDLVRKITGRVREMAKWYRRVLSLSEAGVEKMREQLEARLEERGRNLDEAGMTEKADRENDAVWDWTNWKLSVLDRFGGTRYLLPSEARERCGEIQTWMAKEGMAWAQKMEAITRQYEADRKTIVDGCRIVDKDGRTVKHEKDTRGEAFWRYTVNTIDQRLRLLFARAGGDAGRAAKALRDRTSLRLTQGTTRYKREKQEMHRALLIAVRNVVGQKGVRAWIERMTQEIPEEQAVALSKQNNRHLTYGQVMHLYGYLRQTATYGENIAKYGREEQRDYIERNVLTAEDINILDGMMQIYADNRRALDEASRDLTGFPIKNPDPFYLPVKIKQKARSGLETTVSTVQAMPAVFSERRRHGLDVDEKADVMVMFYDRMEQTARVLGFGRTGLDIIHTFGSSDVKEAITEARGAKFTTALIAHFTDWMNGGRPRLLNKEGEDAAVLNSLRTAFVYTALWGNMLSAFKQTLSAPVFTLAREAGERGIFRDMMGVFSDGWKQAKAELTQSDPWKARYGDVGLMQETEEAVKGSGDGTIWQAILRAGMQPLQWGDATPGILCQVTAYMVERDRLIEEGTEPEEAKRIAADKAMQQVEWTQQSSRPENLPEYSRRGSSAMRMMMMFASSPMLQAGWEVQRYNEWKEKRDAFGADAKETKDAAAALWNAVVVNHVVMPVLFQTATAIFNLALGKEPPDEKSAIELAFNMLIGPFARLVFLGGMAKAVWNAAWSQGIYGRSDVVPSMLTSSEQNVKDVLVNIPVDLFRGDMDEALEDIDKFLKRNVAPYRHGRQAYENWTD